MVENLSVSREMEFSGKGAPLSTLRLFFNVNVDQGSSTESVPVQLFGDQNKTVLHLPLACRRRIAQKLANTSRCGLIAARSDATLI
jgi:hypothetical protein